MNNHYLNQINSLLFIKAIDTLRMANGKIEYATINS